MIRGLRYALPFLLVLAILSIAVTIALETAARRWFVRDVAQRAQLAVNGTEEAFAASLRSGDRVATMRLLDALTRDERIMSAAVCGPGFQPVAVTELHPDVFSCVRLARRGAAAANETFEEIATLPGGRVHLSAIPIREGDAVVGTAVLVHDLSFVDRRESLARRVAFAVLALLGAAAFLATLAAARFSFKLWTRQMRDFLLGKARPKEFQPLMSDLRELLGRLATEAAEASGVDNAWTPQRLKLVLNKHLHGEKVLVLANREPYIHQRRGEAIEVQHPASGLVTALEPVMRACSGTWIAHGSGSADRETVDRKDRVRVPPGEESYILRRVWLTREQEQGYYYGFSNEGLWPLCHLAHTRPTFRADDFRSYQEVNRIFADAICQEVDSEDPIIFVQDYHFALAPRMIRERLPKATVLTFWHIPWPNSERVGICPWRVELIDGLLGSSILGFHTQQHCNNFLGAVDRFLEARLDREQQGVVLGGRLSLVRPYPISIEWPSHWAAQAPAPEQCRREVFGQLGLPPDGRLGVGVDRIDYTKGIEERLLAVERLLERWPEWQGRFTFVQIGAPSRTAIPQYQALNDRVEQLARRINEKFGRERWRPIVLKREHHEPPAVFRYYRAADLCYVSSLHDGMNLVAKEYVAAREDEQGVLVLSQFTGAARELAEALVVNPYDLEQASAALRAALTMSAEEQRVRMRAMRRMVSEFNVYRWAGRMLADAARLRDRERLFGRLAGTEGSAAGGFEP